VTEFQISDHFDGKRFFNPNRKGEKTFRELYRMFRTSKRAPWPKFIPNSSPGKKIPSCATDKIAVTFIGQSTFLLQIGATNILTDPIFSRRPSPISWLGPKRVRPPGIALEHLPQIHLVLVSHNHYDHLDLRSLRELNNRFAPRVIAPLGNQELIWKSGLREISELDWWQTRELEKLRITLTPAQHFCARHFSDRNKALWGGFVIEGCGQTIFFAGDTGYATHFKEIAARFPKIDLALLPIGSYEPRWFMRDLHMNPKEAVQAFLDLRAEQGIGMHFGTFQLTDEAIDEPVQHLQRELKLKNISAERFRVLDFGETAVMFS
jgi:L-ascorbate metabolism protein UlaG (beta-lactamase superfamily)